MSEKPKSTQARARKRERQGQDLGRKGVALGTLAAQQNKEEFFEQIVPLLQPLESYIERRLRIEYLTMQIRTPLYTSGDILDEVVLKAYINYGEKPQTLSLEEWLYQIANEKLEKYLRKRVATEGRLEGLETLEQKELRTLEEMPITADGDGEVWLLEDLDDSEYQPEDFVPPTGQSDPEKQLVREEEVTRLLRAFSRIPEQERTVFELFVIEAFPKEAVARICKLSPNEVPRVAERVREQVLNDIKVAPGERREGAR
ncbi:MAG: sigma-70 family RNA polymerase sigma factor [Candidatus Sulfotelmatobacter sp.]